MQGRGAGSKHLQLRNAAAQPTFASAHPPRQEPAPQHRPPARDARYEPRLASYVRLEVQQSAQGLADLAELAAHDQDLSIHDAEYQDFEYQQPYAQHAQVPHCAATLYGPHDEPAGGLAEGLVASAAEPTEFMQTASSFDDTYQQHSYYQTEYHEPNEHCAAPDIEPAYFDASDETTELLSEEDLSEQDDFEEYDEYGAYDDYDDYDAQAEQTAFHAASYERPHVQLSTGASASHPAAADDAACAPCMRDEAGEDHEAMGATAHDQNSRLVYGQTAHIEADDSFNHYAPTVQGPQPTPTTPAGWSAPAGAASLPPSAAIATAGRLGRMRPLPRHRSLDGLMAEDFGRVAQARDHQNPWHTSPSRAGATQPKDKPATHQDFCAEVATAARPSSVAGSFLLNDDDVVYPRPRHRLGWLKKLLLAAGLIAAGFAARGFVGPRTAPKVPTPVTKTSTETPRKTTDEASATSRATPAAAAVEPVAPAVESTAAAVAPEVQAQPTARELAKARRSAARAAIVAERWRERHAARLSRAAQTDDSTQDALEDSAATPPPAPATSAIDEELHPKREPAQPSAGTGVVRVNSRPWSQVYVDGKWVGHTPQMNLQLPAGEHQLKLINEAMGLSKTLSVQVTAGSTVTKVANLDQ